MALRRLLSRSRRTTRPTTRPAHPLSRGHGIGGSRRACPVPWSRKVFRRPTTRMSSQGRHASLRRRRQ
eukprot:8900429-Prorocentrum_lima.AAC.1